MRNHYLRVLFILCSFLFLLAACGDKSQEDVISELNEVVETLDGYKAEAEMKMNTGQEEQRFSVNVWHQKDDYYRVKLGHSDGEKDNQIILKNEDGVFVLTPTLEKSFRFQTDWPENSSQPYLYHSLVKDVLQDVDAIFTTSDDHYIFKTKTSYQANSNLPYQEIYFNKKTYTPSAVRVLDKDDQALVEVQFSSFDFDVTFETDDFAMEKNMEAGQMEIPTASMVENTAFPVYHPLFTAGADPVGRKDIDTENGSRVILTYGGSKSFTLIQEKNIDIPVLQAPQAVEGEIVNLGFAVGALSDQKLEWVLNGIEYKLASDTLTREELIEVAQSVRGQEIK